MDLLIPHTFVSNAAKSVELQFSNEGLLVFPDFSTLLNEEGLTHKTQISEELKHHEINPIDIYAI